MPTAARLRGQRRRHGDSPRSGASLDPPVLRSESSVVNQLVPWINGIDLLALTRKKANDSLIPVLPPACPWSESPSVQCRPPAPVLLRAVSRLQGHFSWRLLF